MICHFWADFVFYLRWSGTLWVDGARRAESQLIQQYHAVEVSLTYPNQRGQHGIESARRLIDCLQRFMDVYGLSRHAAAALEVARLFVQKLKERGVDGDDLADRLQRIYQKMGVAPHTESQAGALELSSDEVQSASLGSFESLVLSRHSIRDYERMPVADELVEKAIGLAMRSPSACNRQPWRVYDLRSPAVRDGILRVQNNKSEWRYDPDRLLLVTTDVRCYAGPREKYAAHVDGALFAMTLVYALHHLGLGTCFLNLHTTPAEARQVCRMVGADEGEVPLVLIAAGSLKRRFSVAASMRRGLAEVWRKV